MPDYSRLGYNENLINQNSPLARPLGQDAYTFNSKLVDTGVDIVADQSVKQTSIANNVVQGSHITGNSITGTHVINGGLGSDDIAAANIRGSHLGGSVVAGTHIANGAVDSIHITGSAVDGTHYATLDLEKGTGSFINVTNIGTFGTARANSEFSANGTAGFSGDIDVATTATITVTYGLVTGTA